MDLQELSSVDEGSKLERSLGTFRVVTDGEAVFVEG